MSKLPLLNKNAYLSIVIKDNSIFSHLAYVDYNRSIQYILSDYTDISHLNKRLDDHAFMGSFWRDYFDILQKNWDWKLFFNQESGLNRVLEFNDEYNGVGGIKILVDDNQRYITNIFNSISSFSHDITVRVADTQYIYKTIGKLAQKLNCNDLVYIDLDINAFQIYRARRDEKNRKANTLPNEYKYQDMSIIWRNPIGIIDSIRDRRLRAFLATDSNNTQIENNWANLVMHPVDILIDSNVKDILRGYTTVQLLSLLTDSREKLQGIGQIDNDTMVIIGGKIPKLLGKQMALLSLIDGLELYGNFNVVWDNDSKVIAYGLSSAQGSESQDIVIGINEILSGITKVVIPELKSKKAVDKVIFSSTYRSQDFDPQTDVVLGDTFSIINIENRVNKVIFEGKFEDNVYIPNLKDGKLEFVSSPSGIKYEQLLIDSRLRPVVYGIDSYSNKLKLNKWLNVN
jgi:hypothetical protein